MGRETNIKRVLVLTALGCGVYLSKEFCYWLWKREKNGKIGRKGDDNSYMRHPAYDRYPDLSVHNSMMARFLTPEVYEQLK